MGAINQAYDWWQGKVKPSDWQDNKTNRRWSNTEDLEVWELVNDCMACQFHGANN